MRYTETVMDWVYDQYRLTYSVEETVGFIEDESDLTREEIIEMIEYGRQKSFDDFKRYFDSIVNEFRRHDLHKEITCAREKIKWSKESGVYVVTKTSIQSFGDIVYIGMTGKFSRDDQGRIVFNSGSFDKRKGRWTPYRFCESPRDGENQFTFRWGPIEKSVSKQREIMYEKRAYREALSYLDIRIHCFVISHDHDTYTPELLEKEILTRYLKASGDLPPANNEL